MKSRIEFRRSLALGVIGSLTLLSLPSAFALGVGAGGGGNLYQGKLVDTLPVDVTKSKAFKQVVEPVIQRLKAFSPQFGDIFESSAQRMTWYLLPTALPKVAKEVNGVPVPTEQGAVQIGDEVWIDTRNIDTQTLGELMVHEIALNLANGTPQERHRKARAFTRVILDRSSDDSRILAVANNLGDYWFQTAAEAKKVEEGAHDYERKKALSVLPSCTQLEKLAAEVKNAKEDQFSETDASNALINAFYFGLDGLYGLQVTAEVEHKLSDYWNMKDTIEISQSDYQNRKRPEAFHQSPEQNKKYVLDYVNYFTNTLACEEYKREFPQDFNNAASDPR